jgi:hypothetical protein
MTHGIQSSSSELLERLAADPAAGLRDTVAQVGHGARDGLSLRDQLGPLPGEQRRALPQQQREEVDAHLVEQAGLEQLPGDVRAQDQDVLVPGGILGAPGRGLQPVEGERPAVVTEQVR